MLDLISQQVCGWAAPPPGWSLRCSIPLQRVLAQEKGIYGVAEVKYGRLNHLTQAEIINEHVE